MTLRRTAGPPTRYASDSDLPANHTVDAATRTDGYSAVDFYGDRYALLAGYADFSFARPPFVRSSVCKDVKKEKMVYKDAVLNPGPAENPPAFN